MVTSLPPLDSVRIASPCPANWDDMTGELDRFAVERVRSIEWLRSLGTPDWNTTHQHPKLGPMRAGDVLASWAAHEALHLRQLAKRLYELVNRDADGYQTEYAGEWIA